MGARVVSVPPERVAAVRGFNRFYTNAIGALREGLLDSPYSLTEARLIFELAQVERMDVVDLRRSLDIDAGYLSRILARFERAGLVTRERSERDARRQVIRLARRGRSAFKMLDSRSAKETGALLGRHDPDEQRRLVDAMRTISGILGCTRPEAAALVQQFAVVAQYSMFQAAPASASPATFVLVPVALQGLVALRADPSA